MFVRPGWAFEHGAVRLSESGQCIAKVMFPDEKRGVVTSTGRVSEFGRARFKCFQNAFKVFWKTLADDRTR